MDDATGMQPALAGVGEIQARREFRQLTQLQ